MRLKITGTMGIMVSVSTRAGPTVSTKKVLMKDGASSLDTKKCVYLQMIQKWPKKGDTKYICMGWSSEANHRGAVGWEAGKKPCNG